MYFDNYYIAQRINGIIIIKKIIVVHQSMKIARINAFSVVNVTKL